VLSIIERGTRPRPAVVRLDQSTGHLDGSFGVGGILPVAGFATGLAVSSDGKLITVSRVPRNGAFVLYLARRTL
jgi:hypothetical protein